MINTMRSNLLNGKLDDNKDPMIKFRDNCHTVLNTYVLHPLWVFGSADIHSCSRLSRSSLLLRSLGDICNSIPPLPVKLDTSLIPSPSNNQQDL